MTSSNENDSSPVVPAATSSQTDTGSSHTEAPQGEGGERAPREDRGPRHPRRAGSGKHPFNKKRPFNKDKPRREGEGSNGPREGGGNLICFSCFG
jgi:23S rRNA pseudouridine2605 synthase